MVTEEDGRVAPAEDPGQSPMNNTPQSPDAFTIERHGELTLVSATPALETLEFGLEEQIAELLMEPLRQQDSPLVVFDLSGVDYFMRSWGHLRSGVSRA